MGLFGAAIMLVALLPHGWAIALLDWVRSLQADYQGALKDAVLALREDHPGKAAVTLAGLSFLYGVLHAVGPGHGKAVIATYAAANLRQVRRAVGLSFGAGIVQALSAITLVSAAFLLIGGGARWITRAGDRVLEPASYAVIALLGAWVAARSGWPLVRRLAPSLAKPRADGPPGHDQTHDLGDHHGHHHERDHDHDHDHGETCGCGCGHVHMPTPRQAETATSWRQIAGLSLAVGLRPCTGALLVLILCFSLGLWAAGIASALCMGLGTALTVSALAVLASTMGRVALPVAETSGPWPQIAGIGGGAVITLLGVLLFLATIARPVHPLL